MAKNIGRAGSPPPTRGTPKKGMLKHKASRITPAYAGNTSAEMFLKVLRRDHPRLRGEHFVIATSSGIHQGSPPPTRGTPGEDLAMVSDIGITPAYAGNTYSVIECIIDCRDHPRLRGEHVIYTHRVVKTVGSPPPTRGTLLIAKLYSRYGRITPAYAGNTILNSFRA